MNAQTVGWLVFLVLTQNFSFGEISPFKIEQHKLNATEGSCIEIKCTVTQSDDNVGAYWFWLKDAKYIDADKDCTGTVIYSTDQSRRPVSPDFKDRVKYIGSSLLKWENDLCSILICNLKKSDSGPYSFRYVGQGDRKWITQKNATLTVTENPCLITFNKPSVIKESDNVELTCSTLSSCPSNPQIEDLTQLTSARVSDTQQHNETPKSTRVSFQAHWQDDGKMFSCQTQDNKDKYLIRNISITVEYAPKEIEAKISSDNVKEGESVTLTCSAKGRPVPTFTWVNNGHRQFSEAKWLITSVNELQTGNYSCEARNQHGHITSNPVAIDVKYPPYVEIMKTPPDSTVKQGDKMTLTCSVTRSNPRSVTYTWLKDGKQICHQSICPQRIYTVDRIEPEDRGSYTCKATNAVGSRTSEPLTVDVQYGPRNTAIANKESLKVKVGQSLTLTCNTDANPAPQWYSWGSENKNKQQTFTTTKENFLQLNNVQRADEACYTCNASNAISGGHDSERACIHVLYPPTEPWLSMDAEVTEGQRVSISCTVESFPTSDLSLTWSTGSNPRPVTLLSRWQSDNTLQHIFNVTSSDAGFYKCSATNSEGSNSKQRELVVKYTPKNVVVKPQSDLVVNENTSLKLLCSAQSHPPVTSFTWMKTTDGKDQEIQRSSSQIFSVKSASPSDSGLYSCAATNAVGTGKSQRTEVKVKFPPKILNGSKCVRQSEVLTCVCISEGVPLPTIKWPLLENHAEYSVLTTVINHTVNSRVSFSVTAHSNTTVMCVSNSETGEANRNLTVTRGQGHSEPSAALLLPVAVVSLIVNVIFIICIVFLWNSRKKLKPDQEDRTYMSMQKKDRSPDYDVIAHRSSDYDVIAQRPN